MLHIRAGAEYLNICSVGWHSISNFENLNLFFVVFYTWHPPRNSSQLVRLAKHLHQQQTDRQKTFVLTYSMHLFDEKSSIVSALAAHLHLKYELKRAKDATCELALCYHKTECDACVFFLSTVPRCERKHWISVQTRCADVKPL